MANRAECDAWIKRVLGLQWPAPIGTVAYAKLLLDWRAAQSRVLAQIAELGNAILSRDDVKGDPRYAQVCDAVRAMPSLVPTFSGELEDLIDAAINAGAGEKATSSIVAAQRVIPRYRALLSAAAGLAKLEGVAKTHLAPSMSLLSDLDHALGALESELAIRVAASGG